jgi:hypothetical protein
MSNHHHWNRAVFVCRTVSLPPCHCHAVAWHLCQCVATAKKSTELHCHSCHSRYLGGYCHYHVATGTIRTALISSVDCHHCHAATATLSLGTCATGLLCLDVTHCHLPSLPPPISLWILTLPISNHHHSNRLDLLCRLPPLPPCHCHSPARQLRYCVTVSMSLTATCHHCHPRYLCGYCHYHVATGTIRTVSISSVDCHHCHPATATLPPAAPSLPKASSATAGATCR